MALWRNLQCHFYLGGKEGSTLKEISEALGKETIDLYNTFDTRGAEPVLRDELSEDREGIDEQG